MDFADLSRDVTTYHHVLFAVFGLAPWNITSALFAQLPLVLPASPQRAQLASFMDVATNLGNLPMLVYIFLVGRSAFARRQPQSLNAATIYALFVLALITAGGFASLWQETPFGFSLYVVLFALCGGIVGDVMMVTAFPYMTQFHPDYTSSFSTGMSGHGLLTNGLAIIQDVGAKDAEGAPAPRFGVGGFMLLVGLVQLASLGAFHTLQRQRGAIALSPSRRGRRASGAGLDDLLGEKEALTDGEEGRVGESEAPGAGGGGSGGGGSFDFGRLLATQAWSNYVYFLITSLLPYVARIPAAESDASQSQGPAVVIDTELYMWLNFVTTAACGVGALATIKVEVRAPGLLCVLQSACFAMMFGAGVANVYAAPPTPGSLRATLQGGSAQLTACFCASFLNGYIKTFIFTHVSEIRAPAGQQQVEAARFQQIVSRRLSTAAQLAALMASATMFVLGPGIGFFPH